MVNNQIEFNNAYSKETKKIEIRRNRNFQGDLLIENYLELETLNLRDIRSIDKVVLKNLPRLQECTIWDCGLKDLVIENCPQIEILNVRRNLLTSLEFLKGLDNVAKLEKLEVEGNPEISKILEPHQGNWRDWVLDEVRKLERYEQGAWYDIQTQKQEPKEETKLETKTEIPPKSGN